MQLSDSAVYTTILPQRLEDAERGDEPSEVIFERKRWVTAQRLFEEARTSGTIFPVFFSDARCCSDLISWARVSDMKVTQDGTYFTFTHLAELRGSATQDLVLLNDRRNIAPNYIRPYALVLTPSFARAPSRSRGAPATSHRPGRQAPKKMVPAKVLAAPPKPQPAAKLRGISDINPTRKHAERSASHGGDPITLFSWGYSGWGNSIPELLEVTNKAELTRGFKPPVFIDVRFRRSVRAEGFRDRAFEKSLPNGRYRWIKGLGNEGIDTGGMKIHKPECAAELLELAVEEHAGKRRVIFFCSCATPEWCHRNEVRTLVLDAAKKRRLPIRIAEWPGGEPEERSVVSLTVTPHVFTKILAGGPRIPIAEDFALDHCAALPWGSVVDLSDGKRHAAVSVGPAQFSAGGWFLPVFVVPVEDGDTFEQLREAIAEIRTSNNYKVFSTA